jgi:signal peptidase I
MLMTEETKISNGLKEFLLFLFEILKIVVVAALIVIPIRYFLFQPFIVRGDSMLPNFEDGDYLLIDEISFRFREPKRGETIVFKPPNHLSTRYIKRIIGLPGEKIVIKGGKIIISKSNSTPFILNESEYLPESSFTPGDIEIALGEREFFVLGDNRQFSSDSRVFGVLSQELIIGRVFFRAFPLHSFSAIGATSY